MRRPPRGGGAIALTIDGATRPVLEQERRAAVVAHVTRVGGQPADSLATACAVSNSIQRLTLRYFEEAAALAHRQHALATALRPAATDGHVFWIRHLTDASGDSVTWSVVRTDGTLLTRVTLAASDSVAPLDASRALVARHDGRGDIAIRELRLATASRRR